MEVRGQEGSRVRPGADNKTQLNLEENTENEPANEVRQTETEVNPASGDALPNLAQGAARRVNTLKAGASKEERQAKSNERRAELENYKAKKAAEKAQAAQETKVSKPKSALTCELGGSSPGRKDIKISGSALTDELRTESVIYDQVGKDAQRREGRVPTQRGRFKIQGKEKVSWQSPTRNVVLPNMPPGKVKSTLPVPPSQETTHIQSPKAGVTRAKKIDPLEEVRLKPELLKPLKPEKKSIAAILKANQARSVEDLNGPMWNSQMQYIQLLQFTVLNQKLQKAYDKHQAVALDQIRRGTDLAVSQMQKAESKSGENLLNKYQDQAEAVLSSQQSRLELYKSISDEHECSTDKLAHALRNSLQSMPLEKGVTCGHDPEAVNLDIFKKSLSGLWNKIDGMGSFLKSLDQNASSTRCTEKLRETAETVSRLNFLDDNLKNLTFSNTIALKSLQTELLQLESIEAHLQALAYTKTS